MPTPTLPSRRESETALVSDKKYNMRNNNININNHNGDGCSQEEEFITHELNSMRYIS